MRSYLKNAWRRPAPSSPQQILRRLFDASRRLKMRTEYAPFFRSTVGFDHLFELLEQGSERAYGYPPYNIERVDENDYRVTVAVAGFAEKDLNIEVRDGVLTVEGKRDPDTKATYLHQGI